MKTIGFRLIFLFAICVTYVWAQEATKPSSSPSQQSSDSSHSSQSSAADTPQPAPEMQSLAKALTGKWSVTDKFEPNEAAPNGGVGYGEQIWRSGPGGFTFMEEEHNHTPFGEVFLIGFTWWDNTTKSFRGMECSSQNPHGCDLQGALNGVSLKWDGKQFVVDMEFSENGKKMAWHEVFFDITPTSFTQTGEMGEVGGPLKRVVTIHATKVTEK